MTAQEQIHGVPVSHESLGSLSNPSCFESLRDTIAKRRLEVQQFWSDDQRCQRKREAEVRQQQLFELVARSAA